MNMEVKGQNQVHHNELKLGAYIKSSKYRRNVIIYLKEHNLGTPTEIADGINIKVNHISKVLNELKSHNLVVCLNEEYRKGRLYQLTPNAHEVLRVIAEEGLEL